MHSWTVVSTRGTNGRAMSWPDARSADVETRSSEKCKVRNPGRYEVKDEGAAGLPSWK